MNVEMGVDTNRGENRWDTVPVSEAAQPKLQGTEVYGMRFKLLPKDDLMPDFPRRDFRPDWEELHEKWTGTKPEEIRGNPTMSAYADFYRTIGLNPKETPPSVQNLIQRFLCKPTLERTPAINAVVDAVNVAAVTSLIPLGVFDAGAVEGKLHLDTAGGDDQYLPLGMKEPVRIAEGVVVLRDSEKVLSQFCYRDSEAQKVTPQTCEIWLLGCKVPGVSEEQVKTGLSLARRLLERDFNLVEAQGVSD